MLTMSADACPPLLYSNDLAFPDVHIAQIARDGLVAVGGDLSVPRLLQAYRQGIFPWYDQHQPILWWAPAERMVLFTDELNISRSLAKNIRNKPYRVSVNHAFAHVLRRCARTWRRGQNGTWLTAAMQQAYYQLYKLNHACSFECWKENGQGRWQLAGGLYGVIIGRVFYGESMFAYAADASKLAFVHAVRYLQNKGVSLIDCQMYTDHLARFGAREIAFAYFRDILARDCSKPLVSPIRPAMLIDNKGRPIACCR